MAVRVTSWGVGLLDRKLISIGAVASESTRANLAIRFRPRPSLIFAARSLTLTLLSTVNRSLARRGFSSARQIETKLKTATDTIVIEERISVTNSARTKPLIITCRIALLNHNCTAVVAPLLSRRTEKGCKSRCSLRERE
jgi:hypothetical protein